MKVKSNYEFSSEAADYMDEIGTDYTVDLDAVKVKPPKVSVGSSGNMTDHHVVDVNALMQATGTIAEEMRRAATMGNWNEARKICSENREWARMPLGDDKNTALHIATSMNQTTFVRKLLELLTQKDMEIQNADENTAFCVAAISGNLKIAKLLFTEHKRLAFMSGHRNMLPIELAASNGHLDMVKDICRMMEPDISQDHIHSLFFLAISYNLYDLALNLLKKDHDNKLSTSQNTEGLTALQVLARQPPENKVSANYTFSKEGYHDLVWKLYEAIHNQGKSFANFVVLAMFDAAKSGNLEIMQLICSRTPDLILRADTKGQTVLHIAVSYRQQEVTNLLLSMGSYNYIMQLVDDNGDTILHLAGKKPPEESFRSSRPNTQMLREELWFKELEERVPPLLKIMENKQLLTPRKLFYLEHKDLFNKAESTVKKIAEYSMVVATLIVAIVFAAATTVPSKDTHAAEETPIFQKKGWYIIFILSNALALFSSSVSVVFYLSILSSSFPEDVFISSLQKRLMFGFAALFYSMATMVVAFTAACFLIFDHISTWVAYIVALLGCIPLVTFLGFHLTLLADLLLPFRWGRYLLQMLEKDKDSELHPIWKCLRDCLRVCLIRAIGRRTLEIYGI